MFQQLLWTCAQLESVFRGTWCKHAAQGIKHLQAKLLDMAIKERSFSFWGTKRGLRTQDREVYYQYEQASKFRNPNHALQYSRVGIAVYWGRCFNYFYFVLVEETKEIALTCWWRMLLPASVLMLEICCNFTPSSEVADLCNCGTEPYPQCRYCCSVFADYLELY